MNAYEEVVFNCCSKEAIQVYENLNNDGKLKMLEAVKDCILSHNNMHNLAPDKNVSLQEESWIYEKEIASLRKAIEASGSAVFLKYFNSLLTIFRHWGENKQRHFILMNHCLSIDKIKKHSENYVNFVSSSDVIIKTDNSVSDFTKFQQIFIKDLKLFSIAKESI